MGNRRGRYRRVRRSETRRSGGSDRREDQNAYRWLMLLIPVVLSGVLTVTLPPLFKESTDFVKKIDPDLSEQTSELKRGKLISVSFDDQGYLEPPDFEVTWSDSMPLPEEGLTVQAGKFFEEYSELRAVSESFTVVGKKHFEVNRQNNNQLLKAVFHTGQAIDEDISPGSPYGLYAVGVSMHNSHNAAISTVVTNFNYLFQLASESGLNRSIVLPNNNKQINVIDEEYVEFENTSKRKGAGGYISADLKEGFSFYSDFFLQGRFYLEPENRRQPIAFELGIRPEYTRYTQLSVVIGDGTFDAHTIRFNREPAPEGRVKNCPYGVGYGPDSNWFEVRVDRDEVNPVKSICTLFLARSEQELLARVKQNKFAHARTFETMEVANPEHRSTKDSILVRLAARARGTVRLHHLTIGESYDHSSRNLKEIKEVLARQMGLTPKSL